jgi:hypothetical protein
MARRISSQTVCCRIRSNPLGGGAQRLLQARLYTPFFITVSLVEAVFFINLAFMALFVFATPGK